MKGKVTPSKAFIPTFLPAVPSSQERIGAAVRQDSRELLLRGQPQWEGCGRGGGCPDQRRLESNQRGNPRLNQSACGAGVCQSIYLTPDKG